MTKEQFKQIAKVMMKAKADIDNILEGDIEYNMSYNNGTLYFSDGELHFTPICDIDNADIRERNGFFVLREEF